MSWLTPLKFKMEPENQPLEKEIPLRKPSFSGSMLNFGGVLFNHPYQKLGQPYEGHPPNIPILNKKPREFPQRRSRRFGVVFSFQCKFGAPKRSHHAKHAQRSR